MIINLWGRHDCSCNNLSRINHKNIFWLLYAAHLLCLFNDCAWRICRTLLFISVYFFCSEFVDFYKKHLLIIIFMTHIVIYLHNTERNTEIILRITSVTESANSSGNINGFFSFLFMVFFVSYYVVTYWNRRK